MTHICRRFVARLLIASLLFLQLAVAAYACPAVSPASDVATSVAMADDMPMDGSALDDPAQPNLCKQHCEQNSQVLDQSLPVALATPILPLLAVVDSEPGLRCVVSADSREFLARATAPPAAIRFCVFRI
jgi:hypothetical protein